MMSKPSESSTNWPMATNAASRSLVPSAAMS
jgi:hypothetical protein